MEHSPFNLTFSAVSLAFSGDNPPGVATNFAFAVGLGSGVLFLALLAYVVFSVRGGI